MDLNYSILQDELALEEIRKHKWIESEKQKREVGFATAAVDWVKKYGQEWKAFRSGLKSQENIFAERRIYRRFNRQLPLELKIGNQIIKGYTENVSLMGFSCALPLSASENIPADVIIDFKGRKTFSSRKQFRFKSRALKASMPDKEVRKTSYKAFFLFDERVKKYLKANPSVLDRAA